MWWTTASAPGLFIKSTKTRLTKEDTEIAKKKTIILSLLLRVLRRPFADKSASLEIRA
jgi:hypothetical protein